MNFSELVEKINSAVWGAPTLILIVSVGVYYTVRLKFFQFSRLPLWLSNTLFALFKKDGVTKKDGKNSLSQFQALSTSLAATIGTGNIAGVAAAIASGGPGAVFWMWLCSLFSMMTSYAENALGIFFRESDENGAPVGGPMYYLKNGLSKSRLGRKTGVVLASAFSFFTLLASFGIGNMTQSNSISGALFSSLGVSKIAVGLVTALLTLLVISGGASRIGSLTEKLVPFMALFYLSASFCIIFSNIKSAPDVFSCIFKSAFSLESALGGVGGAAIKRAISVGFRRGVFSNEAGLGSTVMVGASSSVKEPAVQGMWGIFQVFVDTTVICTVTAFVLLSTSVTAVPLDFALGNPTGETRYILLTDDKTETRVPISDSRENQLLELGENGEIRRGRETTFTNVMALRPTDSGGFSLEKIEGSSLVLLSFRSFFGKWADVILSVAVTLFAFSTIVGWSFYGSISGRFLFGEKFLKIYKPFFCALTFIGAISKLDVIWNISDIFNGLMAVPNLVGVIFLSGDVLKVTESYLKRKRAEKIGKR